MSIHPASQLRDDTQEPNDDLTRDDIIARVAARTDASLSDLAYTRILKVAWSEFNTLTDQDVAIARAIEDEVASIDELSGAAAALRDLDTESRRQTYIKYDQSVPWLERGRPTWAHPDNDQITVAGGSFSNRSSAWRSGPVLTPASNYGSKATANDGRIVSTFQMALHQRTAAKEPAVVVVAPDGNQIQMTAEEAGIMARALLLHVDLAVEGGAFA